MKKATYLILCIVGTLLPYSQSIPFLWEHGLDTRLFFQQLFATRIASVFALDILVSSVALWGLRGGRRNAAQDASSLGVRCVQPPRGSFSRLAAVSLDASNTAGKIWRSNSLTKGGFMAENINLDRVRGDALQRIEKSERQIKWALLGAGLFEGLFLLVFLLAMERGNRTQLLLLIATVGGYTIVVLGLVVLGLHGNRNTARLLKAIELLERK